MPDQGEPRTVAIAHHASSFRRGLAAAFGNAGFAPVDHEPCQRRTPHVVATDGDLRVLVVLATQLDPEVYRRHFADGARAVVHVDAEPDLVVDVACRALAGETVLPTEMLLRLVTDDADDRLTPDEIALLKGLAGGARLAQLAEPLFASERTLRRRLQAACIKLGAPDRAAALTIAGERGLLD